MWRELTMSVCAECGFAPPADALHLQDAETTLGVVFPREITALFRESDGIPDRFGNGIFSVERMITVNQEMRADSEQDDLYMPFNALLFFADAGSGDLFFFPIQGDGEVHRPDIFVWEHETDSRRWVAASLEAFVEQWYSEERRV